MTQTTSPSIVSAARWPRPRRYGWADLFGPLGVASVIIVICIWLVNEGILSLTTLDSAVGSLGLLTGLLASDLMLLQVILLARIPWIERAWGHDLLARRHRLLGLWSFWLLVAHIGAYVIQRSIRAGGVTTDAMWSLFVTEPWMLWATVGTVMIIAVVVTSIRIARKKLRYESWHLLHLYAYLGMTFALPHQIADGADFHAVWTQVFWWSLYALALAAVLVWRLGVPIAQSIRHRLRVAAVTTEGPGVVSVIVEGSNLDSLRTKSGQFFIWRFLDGAGWTRGHPYTISDAPTDGQLRVTIQAAGDGSARASQLKPGTRVLIEGPYGTMTAEQRRQPKVLFLAAGVGITPLRALIEDTPYAPGEAQLIYRYSANDHAIFTDELQQVQLHRGLKVTYLPGGRRDPDSWLPDGFARSDRDELLTLVPDLVDHDIFVCGPPAWITTVKKAAAAAGVRRDQIHSEDFAW